MEGGIDRAMRGGGQSYYRLEWLVGVVGRGVRDCQHKGPDRDHPLVIRTVNSVLATTKTALTGL